MQDLKLRTKKFAVDCWQRCAKIPKSRELHAWVWQFIRCSSSVGANYRASPKGKSTADFINTLKIVEEKADETIEKIRRRIIGDYSRINQDSRKESEKMTISNVCLSHFSYFVPLTSNLGLC